jgi:cytochrome P450
MFLPTMPPRPPKPLTTVVALWKFRQNILSIWDEAAFSRKTMFFHFLNRQILVCNCPDSVRQVFVDNNHNYERKGPQMRSALEPLLGDGLFISHGETWRTRRRMMAPSMHAQFLPAHARIMTEVSEETEARWAAFGSGARIDVLKEMGQLAARIITRAVFGDDIPVERARQVIDGFAEYQAVVDQMDLGALLGLGDWVPRFLRSRTIKAIAKVHAVVDELIDRLGRGEGDPRSFIGRLMVERDEAGTRLSREGLRNEAVVLFMAGHETTANTLAWAWYLIDGDPRVAARLEGEIDAVLGNRTPDLADFPRLVYTRAVIEEAMRLYPPVPILSREATASDTVRTREVTPGTIVLVVPWLLHRHHCYWRDPDLFVPERFLPGEVEKIPRYLYIPFSVGPRACLGMRFGLTEAVLCLATLARRFRLRLAEGHRVEVECRLTLRPKGGLPMILERRQTVACAA